MKAFFYILSILTFSFIITPLAESLYPEKLFWVKNTTEKHLEDISYVKEKLKWIGIECNHNLIEIYESPAILKKSYRGSVNSEKLSLVITNNINYKELRLLLLEKLGKSCYSKGISLYVQDLEEVKARKKFSKTEIELIKKNGLIKRCSVSEFLELKKCSTELYDGVSSINKEDKLLTYSELKSDLSLIVDVEDTYAELNINPLKFQKNFEQYYSDKYNFMGSL